LAELGKSSEAASAFAAGLELAKGDSIAPKILAEWGWMLLDAEKPAEADRVFSRLLTEFPSSPLVADARFNLAESANQRRDYTEVVRLLTPLVASKQVVQKTEAVPDGVTSEPKASARGDDSAAMDSLRRLLPAALYRLGRSHVELEDWAEARTTLDRLLAEFPDNPYRRDARFLRAESALRQGDLAAAESGFAALLAEPAVAGDSKDRITALALKQIQCWIAMKRWKQALEGAQTLERKLSSGEAALDELHYAQGQALLGMGRLEEARAAFDKALAARGTGDLAAQAQLMRGETYFHQDKLHEALREFLKVDILYKAARWQAAALLEAGKVYERLDQWADAAETYERLLKKFPSDPTADEARRRRDAINRRAASSTSGRKS
jgi:TolA-binding protein